MGVWIRKWIRSIYRSSDLVDPLRLGKLNLQSYNSFSYSVKEMSKKFDCKDRAYFVFFIGVFTKKKTQLENKKFDFKNVT